MPPKKRTSQSGRTPPTSPASYTFHGSSSDQHPHHHLRHTGPSIGTRSSVGATPSKPSPVPASESAPTRKVEDKDKDEGAHEKGSLAQASPPGARTPFSRFVYFLLFSALLLLGWYLYGMVALLSSMREDVGWWGIIAGDSPGGIPVRWGPVVKRPWKGGKPGWEERSQTSHGGDGLEDSLNALADALGVSPMQVASAVKPLIPQASLSSMASKVSETDRSRVEAVRVLLEDTKRDGRSETGYTVFGRVGNWRAEEDVVEESVV